MSSVANLNLKSPYTAKQRNLLQLGARFLVNVADPKIASRAVRLGYDDEEHAEGWRLYNLATGAHRPFSHSLSVVDQLIAAQSDAHRADLKLLDAFENEWFAVARTTLQRSIPKKRRDAVVAGFFANLTQQPLGPAVIDSVEHFLDRVAELATSPEPGASKAHAALQKKGLTEDRVVELRSVIRRAKSLNTDVLGGATEEERQATAAAQAEAFEEFELWYRDWAGTLRGKLGYHDEIRLGLRTRKGGRSTLDEDVDLDEEMDDVDEASASEG